jgi:hypothetical protein
MIYESILNGNIKSSLEEVCLILHKKERFDELQGSLLYICNFIGMNMNINYAYKWYNILISTHEFLTNEKIVIDNTLILVAKMCVLCKTLHEQKQIGIPQLRKRLLPFFKNPLSSLDIRFYQPILPSLDNESFEIASKIANTFKDFFIKLKTCNQQELPHLINNMRLSFELISRRNIWIETQLNKDHDCIWFLWGLLTILTENNPFINNAFNIFIYDWKSTSKKKRIGILYGSIFLAIICYRSDLAFDWKSEDERLFQHIKKISKKMMETIRNQSPIDNNIQNNNDINFIMTYIPTVKNIPTSSTQNTLEFEQKKQIFY